MKRYPAQASVFVSAFFVASLFLSPTVSAADNYSFSATPGGSGGQIVLSWNQIKPDVQSYNVFYGTEPGKYEFSAINIGGSGVGKNISFTVNYLKPGVKYFFGLSPVSYKKASPPSVVTESVSKQGVVTPPPSLVTVSSGPAPTASLNSVPKDDLFSAQGNEIGKQGVGRHSLSAKPGKAGQVVLNWKQAFNDVDNYDVVYGTEPGKFQYGALNVGKTTSFTVNNLDPNKKYYFALVPVKGGKAQYITQQVAAEGAPVQAPQNTSTSNSNSGGQGTGSGGGSQGSQGGSPLAPGLPLPQPGAVPAAGNSNGGGSQPSGQSSQQTSGGSNSNSGSTSKQDSKKESRGKSVKGIQTILPWFLNLLGL